MVLRGLCGSSFSPWVLFNRAKLSMYAVDQYAILCVSSLESHRVPDCQRKRIEDTGLAKLRGYTHTQKRIVPADITYQHAFYKSVLNAMWTMQQTCVIWRTLQHSIAPLLWHLNQLFKMPKMCSTTLCVWICAQF